MNFRLLVGFAIVVTTPCYAALEFAGYISIGSDLKFVITNTETKKSSLWLSVGESFEGYRISAFDPKHESLTLRKEAETLELPLRPSQVMPGGHSPELARRLEEMRERGLGPVDVVVRWDEKVRIMILLGDAEPPATKRFVRVLVSKPEWKSRAWSRVFDDIGAPALSLETFHAPFESSYPMQTSCS
jgi:hypothetical protein